MVRHSWIQEAEKTSIMMMKTFLHLPIKDLVQVEFIDVETLLSEQSGSAKHLPVCSSLPQFLKLSCLLCGVMILPQNPMGWNIEFLWTYLSSPFSSSLIQTLLQAYHAFTSFQSMQAGRVPQLIVGGR